MLLVEQLIFPRAFRDNRNHGNRYCHSPDRDRRSRAVGRTDRRTDRWTDWRQQFQTGSAVGHFPLARNFRPNREAESFELSRGDGVTDNDILGVVGRYYVVRERA